MPDFRRGAAAVKEAQERAKASGGDFKPFTPSLFWTESGESKEKFVLFLNPMEEIPSVDLIGFIPVPVKGRDKPMYEQVIARTDHAIGEDHDPMEQEWGANPRETNIAVAVELEATYEEVRGRKRPTGFTVKTSEYDRRIRDEKGDLTDEKETVEVPVIGFVTQSPHNFFNLVQSYDEHDGPIDQTALKITRVDSKTYQLGGYLDAPIDLAPLVETIDGLSWLGDDLDDILDQIDQAESDEEAAALIGAFMLDKRLEELVDRERYDDLFEGIDKPFRFGKKDKSSEKKDDDKSNRRPRRERPTRGSQRRNAEPEEAPEAEATPEEKPARRSRAKKADEPKADSSDKAEAGRGRLDELRDRQAKRKAAAAK